MELTSDNLFLFILKKYRHNQIKLKMDKIYIINESNNSNIFLQNNSISFNYGSGIILSSEEYFNKILEIFFMF